MLGRTNHTRPKARRRARLWLIVAMLPLAGCAGRSALQGNSPIVVRSPTVVRESNLGTSAVDAAALEPDVGDTIKHATHTAVTSQPDQVELSYLLEEKLSEEVPQTPEVSSTVGAIPVPVDDPDAAPIDPSRQIDLGASLGMAGGNAWTIQLARQRTVEAHAELERAEAIWLPNLQLGLGWNKHEGKLQASPGNIIDASRNSFFLGGGATSGSPIAGASGGPFRLAADLAIADAYFGPMIARRFYDAERFGVSVARNEAMRDAGIAYMDLLEATARVADAKAAIAAADELVKLTRNFEETGAGAKADVDRAETERSRLQRLLQDAQRQYQVRSATLARRIRLDPTTALLPTDQYLLPVSLTDRSGDALVQIATALAERPEICEQTQRIAALCVEVRKEQVAPWIPNVTMTTSAGMFSGGPGSSDETEGGRGDIDLQAVWEVENMGRGVAIKRKNVASRLAQQRILLADLRDQIRTEVVEANENVAGYWTQIETAEAELACAESSYERNLLRVQNDEGLPIELLQAINARTESLRARTAAVANYNRAQLQLLYVTGQLQG